MYHIALIFASAMHVMVAGYGVDCGILFANFKGMLVDFKASKLIWFWLITMWFLASK